MDRETLLQYCLGRPGTTEEQPFGPDTTVCKVMGKMFALISLTEPRVSLKCEPALAEILRDTYPDDVTTAPYMSKRHWNAVNFEGVVPDDELLEMVDESYRLVVKGLRKADREKLDAEEL